MDRPLRIALLQPLLLILTEALKSCLVILAVLSSPNDRPTAAPYDLRVEGEQQSD